MVTLAFRTPRPSDVNTLPETVENADAAAKFAVWATIRLLKVWLAGVKILSPCVGVMV